MIILTNPIQMPTTLGGSSLAAFDKFRLSYITFDAKLRELKANMDLMSTAVGSGAVHTGRMRIIGDSGAFTFDLQGAGISRQITLDSAQRTAVLGMIDNAQETLETGLLTLGDVVAGTHSPGM